jgi:hypothetical protein
VFYASGVLLVAAFAIGADHLFDERVVRRTVVGACALVFGYHVVRFVETSVAVAAENAARIAILEAAPPGSVAVVPTYAHAQRTRWHLGDDFASYPWLRQYVGGELYDLSGVDLDRASGARVARYAVHCTYDPPLVTVDVPAPTYRQLQAGAALPCRTVPGHALVRATVWTDGLYDDPDGRPTIAAEWTPAGLALVDGRPVDAPEGHRVRVRRATIPGRLESTHVIACAVIDEVALDGTDVPIDERYCRGPFTVIMCEPDRCWVAGWY